jgi:molybdenum-dependent DNA-binding transcriptional regulator ModE
MTDDTDKPTKLTTTDPKPVWERRISKRVAEVVRLIVVGECKTVKAAAERAGMNYTHVCETLKKPHVRVFIDRRVRETIANGTMRATARLIELMDSASDHVSLDAVKHELALNGHQPPSGPAANVNISVMQAGYVIDLRTREEMAAQARVVDVTLTPPREGCKDGR